MQQGTVGALTGGHEEGRFKKRSREKALEQELEGCESRIWGRGESHPESPAGLDAPSSD